MVAIISAAIAAAFNRNWLSAPVKDLIPEGGPSAEQLSRLKARLLGPMEELVEAATRRGRPPRQPQEGDEGRVLREVLASIPQEVWARLSEDRRAALVQAQARLKAEHGLTAARFCELLQLSERTFRQWKAKATTDPKARRKPEPKPKAKNKASQEAKNPGRFDLEVTAPGIQAMGDTTDWEVLGVPLKIVATQDPGNRQNHLWESFAVDIAENADLIIRVATEALQELPGAQFISDQGTPYMANATLDSLEALEIDHAPQREGTPTAKATLERSFGNVKQALEPLTDILMRLAEAFPSLKQPDLAKAAGRVLLSVFLRVYEAASRTGGYPLAAENPDVMRLIIEQQRENARAEDQSVRLTLQQIHRAYRLSGGIQSFVRTHRHHTLEDIQEAERGLESQARRFEDIRDLERYFAAILRNVAKTNKERRANDRAYQLRNARQQQEREEALRQDALREKRLQEQPEAHLEEGLDLVAAQWRPEGQILLAGGKGLGTACIREALEVMEQQDPYTVLDRAMACWTRWEAKNECEEPKLIAVRNVFEQRLEEAVRKEPCLQELLKDKIGISSGTRSRLPIRQSHLRN